MFLVPMVPSRISFLGDHDLWGSLAYFLVQGGKSGERFGIFRKVHPTQSANFPSQDTVAVQ